MDKELRAACRRLVRSISDEILDQRTVDQRSRVVAAFVEERIGAGQPANEAPPVLPLPERMPPAIADRKGAVAELVGSLIAAGRHAGKIDQVRRCVQEARFVLAEIDRQEDLGAPLNDLRMGEGDFNAQQQPAGPVGKWMIAAPTSGRAQRPALLSDAARAAIGCP